jgi:uncharacterized membrane protein YqjE
MSTPDSRPGILTSLRNLGEGLLTSVQDRVELVSLELQEEKLRLTETMVWIGAAIVAIAMALIFVSLTLVYLCGQNLRLAALAALALAYSVTAVAIVAAFRRHLARQPRPFAATIAELQEDRSCIHKGN